MIDKIDKFLVWAFCGGIWLLAVTIIGKDITTNGPIGNTIAAVAGVIIAICTRPIIAKIARYQLVLIISLAWWFAIYQMAH